MHFEVNLYGMTLFVLHRGESGFADALDRHFVAAHAGRHDNANVVGVPSGIDDEANDHLCRVL
jgi:hypothetical protein